MSTDPARLSTAEHRVRLARDFRLDLTVTALRRLTSNVVDVLTPGGEYLRALGEAGSPAIVAVRQADPRSLTITIHAHPRHHEGIRSTVETMLGLHRDLRPFEESAERIEWLAPLVARSRGLRPPRYPTLWEACVNTVVFQQVSIHAASAITRRLVLALGTPVERDGIPLFLFPDRVRVMQADDALLRETGLSAAKIGTLRRFGEAMASGLLGSEALEASSSVEAARSLREVKGIGPWTAAIILLRGCGRLDVFPPGDSSVAANLALVGGPRSAGVPGILAALGPQRGMLYFALLLARLQARGEIGRPSLSAIDR